jgi:hypothetical protein
MITIIQPFFTLLEKITHGAGNKSCRVLAFSPKISVRNNVMLSPRKE